MAGDEPLEPDAARPAEPTFADVLNSLSRGPGGRSKGSRRGRHSGAPDPTQTEAGTPETGSSEPGDPENRDSGGEWTHATADGDHWDAAEWKAAEWKAAEWKAAEWKAAEWEAAAWEHGDEAENAPAAVRPYARTGGRTHPVRDLAVETLVSTSELGRDAGAVRSVEHIAIARLCERTHSVAEVSALLQLPLGVARVLLADMADSGLVAILRNPAGESGAADLPLMERVLAGLRNL